MATEGGELDEGPKGDELTFTIAQGESDRVVEVADFLQPIVDPQRGKKRIAGCGAGKESLVVAAKCGKGVATSVKFGAVESAVHCLRRLSRRES